MNRTASQIDSGGLALGVGAYAIWGVLPLYIHALRDVPALFEPQAQRYTQAQLEGLEAETDSAGRGGRGRLGGPGGGRGGGATFVAARTQFLLEPSDASDVARTHQFSTSAACGEYS